MRRVVMTLALLGVTALPTRGEVVNGSCCLLWIERVTASTPSLAQSLAPGAVRSPWSIDQDGVPEVTVMVGSVLRIGQRGQAGDVLREIGRRAGLGGIERPRDVPRPVRIPGLREVRPERHELVGERDLGPA